MPDDRDLDIIQTSYTPGSPLANVMQVRARPISMMSMQGDNEAHELAGVAAQELRREDGPLPFLTLADLIPTHRVVKMANMANVSTTTRGA